MENARFFAAICHENADADGFSCFNMRIAVRIPIVSLRQPPMHTRTAQALFAVIFAGLVLIQSSEAGTVRVSFINDAASLEETVGILTNNGCGREATAVFRRVVERYYAEGFQLDRSKFPELKGGLYSFSTMSDVVKALPQRLCDTEHSWDFNCFDTMILLADGKLQIGIRPDENFGPFMVSTMMTNGEEAITFAATARDAFFRISAQWYRDATDSIIPTSRLDDRIGLTAELFRWHLLPMSTTNMTVEKDVWAALRSDWRRAGVRFPERFQVLLYHKADLQARTICTHHTGLLLRHGQGYVYLEKAGGKGPFVRLDFEEKTHLQPWFSAVFDEQEHRNASLFVTFNDSDIVSINGK